MTLREGGGERYYFFMNFTEQPQRLALPAGAAFTDLNTGETVSGELPLAVYAVRVLRAE